MSASSSVEDDDGVMVPEYLILEREDFSYTRSYCEENIYKFVEQLLPKLPAEAQCYVVFISNPYKTIPIWNHRSDDLEDDGGSSDADAVDDLGLEPTSSSSSSSNHRNNNNDNDDEYANDDNDDDGDDDDGPMRGDDGDAVIVWDYHVICVVKPKRGDCVGWIFDFDCDMDFPSPAPEYSVYCLGIQYQLPNKYQHRFRLIQARSFLDNFASDRRHMKDEDTGEWVAQPPPYPPIRGPLSKEAHNLPIYMNSELLPTPQAPASALLDRPAFFKWIGVKTDLLRPDDPSDEPLED